MQSSLKKHFALFSLFTFYFSLFTLSAQPFNPSLFNCMKWRCIGPFRGGRTIGATGVIGHPNMFYMGVNDGGENDASQTGSQNHRHWRSPP